MLKKILTTSLIALFILTQSAYAFGNAVGQNMESVRMRTGVLFVNGTMYVLLVLGFIAIVLTLVMYYRLKGGYPAVWQEVFVDPRTNRLEERKKAFFDFLSSKIGNEDKNIFFMKFVIRKTYFWCSMCFVVLYVVYPLVIYQLYFPD